MIATLTRYAYMPTVALARLEIGSFSCFTIERPWVKNKPNISCLPEGLFECVRVDSPRYGDTFEIIVPGRKLMLFHPANWVHQLKGCVAPGDYVDPCHYSDHGAAVKNSRITMQKLLTSVEGLDLFRLHVTSYRADFS